MYNKIKDNLMEEIIMTTKEMWLAKSDLDENLRSSLEAYSQDESYDAFYTQLEFGTAGMRGLLGAGPNRMNIYTVGRANLGYGKYLLSLGHQDPKVAIAYDNRHYSQEFAFKCAQQLAQLGIESYVFETLRPTPELSFAVRELGCIGGIVITASHNPKEYNGYKVYDETGCQLTPEKVEKVIELVNEVENELDINFDIEPKQEELIHVISTEIDEPYKEAVLGIQLRPEVDKSKLKIVFTPQHGTAYPLMMEIFEEAGYDVELVEEQAFPDSDFINTKTPNPEERDSYDLAITLAEKVDADLILSTDPDADRMGIVVKHQGGYQYLTGNQGGTILLEYILSTLKEKNRLPHNGVIYNTIVTSDAGEKVANLYGVETEKTLTGFKYIGTKIHESDRPFLFGYEESYGYLIKEFVRDKDALQACLMLAEAAAYYKSDSKTLVDVLYDCFEKVGFFVEETVSVTLAGQEGALKIQEILSTLRNEKPQMIGEMKVIYDEDYQSLKRTQLDEVTSLNFPEANVLKYGLEDGSWVAIRPSGTEPKVKFYFCVRGSNQADAQIKLDKFKQDISQIIE